MTEMRLAKTFDLSDYIFSCSTAAIFGKDCSSGDSRSLCVSYSADPQSTQDFLRGFPISKSHSITIRNPEIESIM